MALKHIALAVLFAFVGCKKTADITKNFDDPTRGDVAKDSDDRQSGKKSGPTEGTPAGATQKGPGFTVVAPSAAQVGKGRLSDGQPEEDVYTFKSAGKEVYEVRIHPVTADQDGLQAATLVRDKIVFTAGVKLNEDDISDGTLRGFDLSYKTDDDDHLFVRSKVVANDKQVFHVRATYPKKDMEDAANAFVDSFAVVAP